MLDVNRLRVIDAVARHGSVTAAAKELHYSQPSVTHHLARLEAETGAQLLQRVGRGIRLTPAGQLLADRAAEIIGRIDAAGAELSAHVGLTAGRVRLAGFASANGSLVPAALATLADQASGPGDQPDRHASARGARAAAHRQGRGRDHLPLRRDRARAGRGAPASPARRSGLRAVDAARARAGRPARRDVDRRLRALPQPPAVPVRRRRVRSADRLQLRRHGRDAGVGGRRARGGDPDRAWPCAPTTSTASSRPSCPARSGTSTPRPTASRPTRPPPPPSWRPSPRPPRRRPRRRSPPPDRASAGRPRPAPPRPRPNDVSPS